jgi:hypothetical protein
MAQGYNTMAPKGPLVKIGLYPTPAITTSAKKIMQELGVTGNEIGAHAGASITFDSFCGLVKQAVGSDVWGSLKNPGQPVRKAISESKTPRAPRTPKTPKAPKAPKAPQVSNSGWPRHDPFSGGNGGFQRAANPVYVRGKDPNMDRMYNQMFGL